MTARPEGAVGSAPTRRSLLTAGLAGLGGAVAGATVVHAVDRPDAAGGAVEPVTVPFHGTHQAGIATPGQTAAAFLAFDLEAHTDRAALVRLLRLWTDDAARLTQGDAALADTEGELAASPARLTVTLGLGPRTLDLAGVARADRHGVAVLPAFGVDALEDAWSDGDLLLQVCADDRLTVAHATRMLTKDARTFARLRWQQHAFRPQPGPGAGQTPRNLLGQVDGTANPEPGTDDFDRTVWIPDGAAAEGSTVVLRRIRMHLDRWDLVGRRDRELVIGRRLDTGAPLTGDEEYDTPDLDATDDNGLLVIPEFAHVRRAHPSTTNARIFRRPFSYQGGAPERTDDAGLLFVSFQADVTRQFVPVQRSLDELDLLNQWTTPVGSAVFLVPPGCEAGGYLGDTLV